MEICRAETTRHLHPCSALQFALYKASDGGATAVEAGFVASRKQTLRAIALEAVLRQELPSSERTLNVVFEPKAD
jgi:hypothetical protein